MDTRRNGRETDCCRLWHCCQALPLFDDVRGGALLRPPPEGIPGFLLGALGRGPRAGAGAGAGAGCFEFIIKLLIMLLAESVRRFVERRVLILGQRLNALIPVYGKDA